MDEVSMILDLVWIPRGVAKKIPDKVKLDEEQLKELIKGGTSLAEGEEEEETQEVEMEAGDEEKEGEDQKGTTGVAMYASNNDDQYVTEHVDSDNEEEKEEFEIRTDDNMVAIHCPRAPSRTGRPCPSRLHS